MDKKNANIYWGEISLYKSILAAMVLSALVLLVDQKDIPSQLVNKYGMKEIMICVFFCTVIIILVFVRRHISDLIKMPCGNAGDEVIIFNIISCILIGICEEILGMFVFYKMMMLLTITIISILIIIARYCFCRLRKNKAQNVSNSIVDLGRLVSGEITECNLPLVFSEETPDYDLLGREGLVNVVYNSIKACNPNHVYVIGLKGAWGSGKTTILNIVKKKIRENRNDVIIISNSLDMSLMYNSVRKQGYEIWNLA